MLPALRVPQVPRLSRGSSTHAFSTHSPMRRPATGVVPRSRGRRRAGSGTRRIRRRRAPPATDTRSRQRADVADTNDQVLVGWLGQPGAGRLGQRRGDLVSGIARQVRAERTAQQSPRPVLRRGASCLQRRHNRARSRDAAQPLGRFGEIPGSQRLPVAVPRDARIVGPYQRERRHRLGARGGVAQLPKHVHRGQHDVRIPWRQRYRTERGRRGRRLVTSAEQYLRHVPLQAVVAWHQLGRGAERRCRRGRQIYGQPPG